LPQELFLERLGFPVRERLNLARIGVRIEGCIAVFESFQHLVEFEVKECLEQATKLAKIITDDPGQPPLVEAHLDHVRFAEGHKAFRWDAIGHKKRL
jgi:hypothetical protein